VREALIQEWYNGREALIEDGVWPERAVSETASVGMAISVGFDIGNGAEPEDFRHECAAENQCEHERAYRADA
jgi:hypothetical protein